MKKVMAMIAVASIAGIAVADINVDLSNGGSVFTTGGGTVFEDVKVQLVYNADAFSLSVDVSGSNSGDNILAEFDTTPGFAGTWSDLGNQGGVFNLGTQAGYLAVRVFNADDMGIGAGYFQYNLDTDGTLATYNAQDLATAYYTDTLVVAPGAEEAKITGGDFSAANGVITGIPEPATLGLMGIAGMGLFLARRKARR